MNPVCGRCRTEMTRASSGFLVVSVGGFSFRSGDKFKCNGCGHEIFADFGAPQPAENLTELGPKLVKLV